MAVSPEFVDYLSDQFARFGPVSVRRMFGGGGVFHQGVMIGLIAEDVLYLKVDGRNRPDFEAAGMGPFTYDGKGKPMQMSYFEAPADVLEDPDDLAAWATKAYEAALAGQKAKKGGLKKA